MINIASFIPSSYALIARLTHDASLLIADTTSRYLNDDLLASDYFELDACEPFISDDSNDYLDAALDILHLCHNAMTSDDFRPECDALFARMMTCDLDICTHDLAIDFDSPIFDLIPDDDRCPHR